MSDADDRQALIERRIFGCTYPAGSCWCPSGRYRYEKCQAPPLTPWECPHCEAMNNFDGALAPTCGACGRRQDDVPPPTEDEE